MVVTMVAIKIKMLNFPKEKANAVPIKTQDKASGKVRRRKADSQIFSLEFDINFF
jgi:hypothetical protein